MKTLLKSGTVINVFTGECEKAEVLLEDEKIIGVGNYDDTDADIVEDVSGKYICPGFIDSHIHIESTMLSPAEFARIVLPCGTTSVIADPHEIANVAGVNGIKYMLEASEGLPMTVYCVLPSCVPATVFDEAGAVLEAGELAPLYSHPRVLGLGEVMNYVGVISNDKKLLEKIMSAKEQGAVINGHAPLLSGKDLDKYISAGIFDDHECSSADEAKERIRKGQRVMIRNGTASKNLEDLIALFDEPWAHRCLLVTDDKHPADIVNNGHIDDIIRQAVRAGKSAVTGIRMATLWAAEYFGLRGIGAVAPGYVADIVLLDDMDTVSVCDVYRHGVRVVKDRKTVDFKKPHADKDVESAVGMSFNMDELAAEDFAINANGIRPCRVIELVKHQLLTNEIVLDIDFNKNNGIDKGRDILKIAVVERHRNTGHIGLAFINGIGIKHGAIASSVSHDSHNLIIIGACESDMALAGNRIREIGGGNVVVCDGKVISEMPLPIGGLMNDKPAQTIAEQNEKVRTSVHRLGVSEDVDPFMTMAFMSLSVIPHIKLTTLGLVDVNRQKIVPLFADRSDG